jgi:hypothetical protein
MIKQIKDYIREKIEDWLIDKFLDKTRTTKLSANAVMTLVSLDTTGIIKLILTTYNLEYLIKYVFLFSLI